MRILGIDPGLQLTGYAVLEPAAFSEGGPGARRANFRTGAEAKLIEAGVLRFKKGRTVSDRLVELETDLADVIGRLEPRLLAIEKLYAHYKHPATAIIMGHARGVVLFAARRAGLDLLELGATEVKKSLTGHGHASKTQMQDGVKVQLGLPARPEPADVADAIAIALCALRRQPSR